MRNEELVIGERYRIADVSKSSCRYKQRDELIGEEVIFHGFSSMSALRLEPIGDRAKRHFIANWERQGNGGYYVTLEPITDPIPVLATPEEEAAWAEEDMKE